MNLLNWKFSTYIDNTREWADKVFGPRNPSCIPGILAHIEEEVEEVRKKPDDLEEWVDLMILSIDGATCAGYSPKEICEMLEYKLQKNMARQWPDWRTVEPGKPINHIKN